MFNITEPWSAARWQEGCLASIKENLPTCPQHSENFLKPHYAFKREFIFGGAPKSLQMVTAAMKLKDVYFLEEKL